MKNLFKYLSIAAIAGSFGLMTATAASTCAADEVEYTDYYMFLSVDPRADYVRDIAALQPGQSLTYFNGADKKNNLLGRADGMPHNVVQIVANGTSGEGADGMVTWTLEDFWKNYYTAMKNHDSDYVYKDKKNNVNYVMHDKWWKYDNDNFLGGKEFSHITTTTKEKLLKRISDNWDNLAQDELLTEGTLIPRTYIVPPTGFQTSLASPFRWNITRTYEADTHIPDGISINNDPSIYSPAVYYAKYCVKKTDTTTPTDPEKKFTVKYDANGGTGAPDSQEGTPSNCVAISTQKPTKDNLNFLGWSVNSNASTPDKQYAAGTPYCGPNDITLYAVYSVDNSPTGVSSHLIVFSVITVCAVGALVLAKKKNLFKQI